LADLIVPTEQQQAQLQQVLYFKAMKKLNETLKTAGPSPGHQGSILFGRSQNRQFEIASFA